MKSNSAKIGIAPCVSCSMREICETLKGLKQGEYIEQCEINDRAKQTILSCGVGFVLSQTDRAINADAPPLKGSGARHE